MKKASKNTNAKRGASKRTMWIIMAVVLIPAAIIFWNIAGRPLAAQASMGIWKINIKKDLKWDTQASVAEVSALKAPGALMLIP